jgi:hypothetical protein
VPLDSLALTNWATIATVLTSLGVGGLLGSVAKGRQETSEKLRDRTIESCRNWLIAHDAVRRDLASAQNHLLPEEAGAVAQVDAAADALATGLTAWREFQTQTFLVSLLLAGGTRAPAAQAAQALARCYDGWRDVLVDLRMGRVERDTARMIIHHYLDLAVVLYNEFVAEINEAIRPWTPWRRGRRGDSDASDAADEAARFAKLLRAESG